MPNLIRLGSFLRIRRKANGRLGKILGQYSKTIASTADIFWGVRGGGYQDHRQIKRATGNQVYIFARIT